MKRAAGYGELLLLLFVVVLLCFIVGGTLLISNINGKYQCENYAEITGKKTRWVTLDICYIQTAEGWQRWDEYLKRGAASEGLKELAK